MNRFGKRKWTLFHFIKTKVVLLLFLVFLGVFLYGLSTLEGSTSEKQRASLEAALHRSIVQCYAVEGTYPPSLDYLEENYGLTYDKERFFIDYLSIGSNLMPDVFIIDKKEGTLWN